MPITSFCLFKIGIIFKKDKEFQLFLDKLKSDISKITLLLKNRNNKAYEFFENILAGLNQEKNDEAFQKIINGYSIVQYADLNFEEEKLFEEIWNLTKTISKEK